MNTWGGSGWAGRLGKMTSRDTFQSQHSVIQWKRKMVWMQNNPVNHTNQEWLQELVGSIPPGTISAIPQSSFLSKSGMQQQPKAVVV